MINNEWFYYALYLFSVLVASLSQVILKKSAMIHYETHLKEYLNPSFVDPFVLRKVPVYGLVGGSTIWSVSNKGITDTEMNA